MVHTGPADAERSGRNEKGLGRGSRRAEGVTAVRLLDKLVTVTWIVLLTPPLVLAVLAFACGRWFWGLLGLGAFPLWAVFVALPIVNFLFRPRGSASRFRWR